MGQKSYLDQDLVEKSMVSPQFEKRVNGSERQLFLANLRPYMNYTLQREDFLLIFRTLKNFKWVFTR